MRYRIEFRPSAIRDLDSLSPDVARRVLRKIEALADDLAGDVKRLVAHSPEYRLRVGDWRVLFDAVGDLVTVFRVLLGARRMNNLSELSPEILRKDGKAQFAVLPWEQYVALREMVEDAMDVLLIREARAVDAGSPSVPVDAVLKRFGLEPNGGSEDR